jgi:hypothetical protein
LTEKSNGANVMQDGMKPLDFGRGKVIGGGPTYLNKFENFIGMCKELGSDDKTADVVLVAAPWVLGDTFDEIRESLSRLSLAGIPVLCATPDMLSTGGRARTVQPIPEGAGGSPPELLCGQTGCKGAAAYLVQDGNVMLKHCRECLRKVTDGGF